jgi:hypothetical protein
VAEPEPEEEPVADGECVADTEGDTVIDAEPLGETVADAGCVPVPVARAVADGSAVPDADREPRAEAVMVASPVPLGDVEAENEAQPDDVAEAVMVVIPVPVGVDCAEAEIVAGPVTVGVDMPDAVRDTVAHAEAVEEWHWLTEAENEGELEGKEEAVPLLDGAEEAEIVAGPVTVGVDMPDAVKDTVAHAEAVEEWHSLTEAEKEEEPEGNEEAVLLLDGAAEAEMVTDPVTEGVDMPDAVKDTVAHAEGVEVSHWLTLPEKEEEPVAMEDSLALPEKDALGQPEEE